MAEMKKWTIEKTAECKAHHEDTDELSRQVNGTTDCPALGLSKRLDSVETKMEFLEDLKGKVTALQWTGWSVAGLIVLYFLVTYVLPAIHKLISTPIASSVM